MYLVLDIGNTSVKAALMAHDTCHSLTHIPCTTGHAAAIDWAAAMAPLLTAPCSAVLISDVGAPCIEREAWLRDLGCPIFRLTTATPSAAHFLQGIPAGYGADRLAADIAARHCVSDAPLLVIDAGTCITYDIIGADGRLLGGSITPGAALRLQAMHDHTAALPLISVEGADPVEGYDTATAMRGGVMHGVRWEIEGYIRHVMARYPDLRVFGTGGGFPTLCADLTPRLIVDKLLVQHGLIAAYESKKQ